MKTKHNVRVYLLSHTGLMTLNLVFKHDPLPLARADFLGNVSLMFQNSNSCKHHILLNELTKFPYL